MIYFQVMRTFSWCEIVGKRFPICLVHIDDTVVEVGYFFVILHCFSTYKFAIYLISCASIANLLIYEVSKVLVNN